MGEVGTEIDYAKVYRWAQSLAGRFKIYGFDRDDLAQEGVLRVMQRAKAYRGDAPFEHYARRCIKTLFLDLLKMSKTKKYRVCWPTWTLSTDDHEENMDPANVAVDHKTPDPLSRLIATEERAAVDAILPLLADDQRETAAGVFHNETYQQSATRLGIKPHAEFVRRNRLAEAIRSRLKG